jgi:alkyl hydroperoxide reductase subunit AhpC
MQQLQVFGTEIKALADLKADLVAVSTDDIERAKELKNNQEGVKFPMPILADPQMKVFKDYRAFDEFEDSPMHGTFIIDAKGMVRFQKISAEPFLDVDFIKTETARINRLNR